MNEYSLIVNVCAQFFYFKYGFNLVCAYFIEKKIVRVVFNRPEIVL